MSCCRNCHIVEVEPGQWYLILEDTGAPRDAWDWTEYADCIGPFTSDQAAYQELEYYSNPGGFSTFPYAPRHKERYAELLKKVQKPRSKYNWGCF